VLPSPRLHRWLVIVCAGLGMFLVALDIAVNVALPTITSHFHTDIQTIQWIIVSFVATRAGLAVAAGSLGDLFGLKRVFLIGVLAYTIAVTLIAFSPSLASVFGLRVLQGVGAGSLYAAAPAIASRALPASQRGTAMGVTTAGYALGTIAGTLGTGLLVGVFGWEAAFLGRVPFCVIAIILGWLVLREPVLSRSPEQSERAAEGECVVSRERRSFDLAGSSSFMAGMVALVLALHMSGRIGWSSPLVIGLLAATPFLLALFVRSELRARWPVLDLHLLRLPDFMAACSSMFFVHLGAFVIWFIFPFYVAEALGRGPIALGAMMALMATAMSLASPGAGWLSDRIHPKYVGLLGTAIVGLGLAWMSMLDGFSPVLDVGLRIAVVGFGLGSFQTAAYTLLLKALPASQLGTGAGSLSLTQAMGSVVSVSLLGLVFALRTEHHTTALSTEVFSTGETGSEALVLAFQDIFRLGAVLASVGMVVLMLSSLSSGRRKLEKEGIIHPKE